MNACRPSAKIKIFRFYEDFYVTTEEVMKEIIRDYQAVKNHMALYDFVLENKPEIILDVVHIKREELY